MILKNLGWLQKGKQLLETLEYLTMQDPEIHHFAELNVKSLIKLYMIRAKEKAFECGMGLNGKPASEFNRQQPFQVREMCESYHQLYLVQAFEKFLRSVKDDKTRAVFEKLHLLYLKSKIIADGEYFRNWLSADQFKQMKVDILDILEQLRPDVYSLTMIIPIPNTHLGPFGNEDLQGYNRYIVEF